MNEPLINPWLFYLIDVVGTINTILRMSMGIVAVLSVLLMLTWIESCDEDTMATAKRMLKKCVITLAVSSVLICIIPSPNTIRAMIIAQQITPKNIEAIGDFTDKAADKIIKKIVKAVKEMESK